MTLKAFLNGEPYSGKIDPSEAYIVACDGGYKYCSEKGICVDAVIGDFDSLKFVPENALIFPKEKDFTDGEAVIDFAVKQGGIEEIEFYNFGGKRDDHFLGNLAVLVKGYKSGFIVRAFTNYSVIFYTEDEIRLNNVKGKTVSIVPFCENANILVNEGLKYNAVGKTLSVSSTLGISNVAIADDVFIKVDGKIFVIVNNGNN